MDAGLGPSIERLTPVQRIDDSVFAHAVSPLAEGALRFRPPFDLASSAALGQNTLTGRLALASFGLARMQRAGTYRLRLDEVLGPEQREVVDVVMPSSGALVDLLHGLLNEWFPDEEA